MRVAALLAAVALLGCEGEAIIRRGDSGVDAGEDAGVDSGTPFLGDAGSCAYAPPFVISDLNGKPGVDPGGPSTGPYNFATFARPSPDGGTRFDVMFNEFSGTAPLTNAAIPARNYELCETCLVIQLACDSMGANCSKRYLAQSGTISVSAATKNPDAGSYAFQLTNVTYQPWDFLADLPIDGGCLYVGNFAFTGSWP
jgi:hypothetical protein